MNALEERMSEIEGVIIFEELTDEELHVKLAESRACYERGEYRDFDEALDEICSFVQKCL